MIFKTSDSMIN